MIVCICRPDSKALLALHECTSPADLRRALLAAIMALADADKPAVLRPYLRRWRWEVGQFFGGVGPDATDEQLLAIADGYPVFAVSPR